MMMPSWVALFLLAGLQAAGTGPQLPPQLAAAVEPYQQAVANNPSSGQAHGELGMFYQAHEFYAEAAAVYRQARQLAPDEARWWYLSAVVAQSLGDVTGAAELLRQTLALAPESEAAAVTLARLHRLNGDEASARRLLEQVLSRADSAAAHAELGQMALAQGDGQRAVSHLQAALALQPAARTLYHPLAAALRSTGEVAAARAALAQAGPGTPRLADQWMDQMQRHSRSGAFI